MNGNSICQLYLLCDLVEKYSYRASYAPLPPEGVIFLLALAAKTFEIYSNPLLDFFNFESLLKIIDKLWKNTTNNLNNVDDYRSILKIDENFQWIFA